jgi:hypothetical protein
MLADNKLTDRSTWDDGKLAIQLKELSDLVLDFDIEAIGFEPPEIDLRIQSLDPALEEADDQFELATGPVVSMTSDLWLLGSHRLYCGNALDAASYDALSNGEKAAAAITDAPYNVRIDGHVSGKGRITHRDATSLCSCSRAEKTRIPITFSSAVSAGIAPTSGMLRGPTASRATAPKSSWNRTQR